MSKQSPVLRRLVELSAVALGAGLVLTACSPVQAGSAAIVGNQRITIATLDTEVTNLSQTVKLYPATVPLSQVEQTQQTLTWLIRFQINEALAKQEGITVSAAQAEKAWDEIFNQSKANAQDKNSLTPTGHFTTGCNLGTTTSQRFSCANPTI